MIEEGSHYGFDKAQHAGNGVAMAAGPRVFAEKTG